MNNNRIITLVCILIIQLAACSPSPQPTETHIAITTKTPEISTQIPGGPGRYLLESNGTVVRVDVPAQPSDKDVVEIEILREKTNTAIVSYLLVEIDNSQGQESIDLRRIVVVNEEGEQVEFRPAWWIIGDWMNTVDISNYDLYNECVNLYNSFLGKQSALPGAVTRIVFIAPQPFTSVKSVWVDDKRLVRSE